MHSLPIERLLIPLQRRNDRSHPSGLAGSSAPHPGASPATSPPGSSPVPFVLLAEPKRRPVGAYALRIRRLMAATLFVFWVFCIFPVSALAQTTDSPWHWIMADSIGASPVCPGRCLAVNDSSNTGDYEDKEVGFVACKNDGGSSGTSDSSQSNSNQQWIYDGRGSQNAIRINSSGVNGPVLLCLQPRRRTPKSSHVGLTVAQCDGEPSNTRSWIVANNSILSPAFDPPLYLAMAYEPSGDGTWRTAHLVAENDPGFLNKSLTKVFSMVEYEQNLHFPYLNISNMSSDSGNFIQNGGFEHGSLDFPANATNLDVDANELFELCHWVSDIQVQLWDGASNPPAEGRRSLLLKGGSIKQNARTRPGSIYTLVFKMAVVGPPASRSLSDASSGDGCTGTDAISVNPFPSTNVRVSLNSSSQNWESKHIGFQALGPEIQITFKGCDACGCYLDDVNLMQIMDPTPFPPPPPFPRIPPPLAPQNPPNVPEPRQDKNPTGPDRPFDGFPVELGEKSNRLSNGAVAGLLVGSSLLFFLIGGACFGVMCLKKGPKGPPPQEGDLRRPPEWSIQTTSPPRSDGREGSLQSISNAAPLPASSPSLSPLHAERSQTSRPSESVPTLPARETTLRYPQPLGVAAIRM